MLPEATAGCPILAVPAGANEFAWAGVEETGGGGIRKVISRSIHACCSGVNIGSSSGAGGPSVFELDPVAIVRGILLTGH